MTAGSTTERVLEAVRELRALDQPATRETIQALTGLKLGIVDDRLRALANDGALRRLIRGVYEMANPWEPPRPIFFGLLSDGAVKLEVGDQVLDLTPQEARSIARGLGGLADDARVIESVRKHIYMADELSRKVDGLAGELRRVSAGSVPGGGTVSSRVSTEIDPWAAPSGG